MSQDSTESTAPLTGITWSGLSGARGREPSTPVDERITQAMMGDQEAADRLIEAHPSSVYRICHRMMLNREDAQDAAQETLVRMVRNLAKYNSAWPFVPWLYSIAMNVCRDHMRKRKRHRTESIESVPPRETGESPGGGAQTPSG